MSSSRALDVFVKLALATTLVAPLGCSSNSQSSGNGGAGGKGGSGGLTGQGGSGGGSGGTGGSSGSGGTGGGTDGGSDASGDACPDTDLDGVNDCVDGCPNDFLKTAPGMCGCGVPDVDSDSDGTADCVDMCPNDPFKTKPGTCGCGSPDTDTDGDGTLDCMDGCPQDHARTTPGTCGCGGIPDTTPFCLVHRYSFSDTGTTITDSITIAGVSPANGMAVNVTSPGTGSILLQGAQSDQYVSLPPGIISSLGNSATFEAWVTWSGSGGAWQRIMDFGNSDSAGDGGTGQGANGLTYLFVTPLSGGTNTLRAVLTVGSIGGEKVVNGPALLPSTTERHVAVVVDGSTHFLSLYQDGVFLGQVALGTATLGGLKDVNNWLGRSQFMPDPEFGGSINEFRIYSSARTAAQIMASFMAGPNALPTTPDGGVQTPDAGTD